MRDIINPAAMWIKAVLLLVIGVTASILLLVELGTLSGALLLALANQPTHLLSVLRSG